MVDRLTSNISVYRVKRFLKNFCRFHCIVRNLWCAYTLEASSVHITLKIMLNLMEQWMCSLQNDDQWIIISKFEWKRPRRVLVLHLMLLPCQLIYWKKDLPITLVREMVKLICSIITALDFCWLCQVIALCWKIRNNKLFGWLPNYIFSRGFVSSNCFMLKKNRRLGS